MPPVDWNEKLKEALERTDIMALSTVGDDGSWTSPVQYSHGPRLELSFVSKMETKHVVNILKDPRVSLAIYDPRQFPGGGSLGLQIKGTAKLVGRKDRDDGGWHTFKITPEEVWYFDSRGGGGKRRKVDLDGIRL